MTKLERLKRWYNRNEHNIYAGIMLAVTMGLCILTIIGTDGCEVSHKIRESIQEVIQ